jgi:hypothetical protein
MSRKLPPLGFVMLCEGLHQDARFDAHDVGALAVNCIAHVDRQLRSELVIFIGAALQERTPAELKGLLNRQKTSQRFSSKAAHAWFVAVLSELNKVHQL